MNSLEEVFFYNDPSIFAYIVNVIREINQTNFFQEKLITIKWPSEFLNIVYKYNIWSCYDSTMLISTQGRSHVIILW